MRDDGTVTTLLIVMIVQGNIINYIPLYLSKRRLAEESWSGYHHAHYETYDEGYQDENDECLRIDEHR